MVWGEGSFAVEACMHLQMSFSAVIIYVIVIVVDVIDVHLVVVVVIDVSVGWIYRVYG